MVEASPLSRAPYRRRTWLRQRLPFWLINLGFAAKGQDCEAAGGKHEWYNREGVNSGCYHCTKVVRGQLWTFEPGEITLYPKLEPAAVLSGERTLKIWRLYSLQMRQ